MCTLSDDIRFDVMMESHMSDEPILSSFSSHVSESDFEQMRLICCADVTASDLAHLSSLVRLIGENVTVTKDGIPWRFALLITAVMKKNLYVVDLLLSRLGFDANAFDGDGTSALSYACSLGHMEIVDCLLSHGALATGASYMDRNGPINCAAQCNHIDVAIALIVKCGCTLFDKDIYGHSPIFNAISEDHLEFFQWAVSPTPSMLFKMISGPFNNKRDMIMHILKKDAVRILHWLCEFAKLVDPASAKVEQCSLMQAAAIYGSLAIIKYLLLCDDVQYYSSSWEKAGQNPVQLAKKHGHAECYRVLSKHSSEMHDRIYYAE